MLYYYRLENAGCPLERHELTNDEWLEFGRLKNEWVKLEIQWNKDHPKT